MQWVPRDPNAEADDLTNEEFCRSQGDRRVQVDLAKIKWLVMDDLMRSAEAIYGEVKSARELKGAGASAPVGVGRRGRRRPEERLRARGPWCRTVACKRRGKRGRAPTLCPFPPLLTPPFSPSCQDPDH